MSFNSYIFLLCILPLTLAGYYTLGRHAHPERNTELWLIAMSLVFYSFVGIRYTALLAGSVAVNYFFAYLIKEHRRFKKTFLISGVMLNVSVLLYFKYTGLFISLLNQFSGTSFNFLHIILPLGVSFFTFQQIAYLCRIAEGTLPSHSFTDYALFILYFPKLIMGPLAEPAEFLIQVKKTSRLIFDSENFMTGLRMFNLGLLKKILLADAFAKVADWGFTNTALASSPDLIIVMLSYTFQIYFDFSGYSDMALGISKMLNIELPINFDSPYKSFSVREFWKRWHISLTRFLTRYIYIPLGGNRKGRVRTYVNMMLVFLVSGLWHGADLSFVLWGALHGGLCVVERFAGGAYDRLHAGFRWIYTFFSVNVLWLLFRAESTTQWLGMLKRIVNLQKIETFHFDLYRRTSFWMIIFSLVLCLLAENTSCRKYRNSYITVIVSALIFIFCLLSLGKETSFVYHGF